VSVRVRVGYGIGCALALASLLLTAGAARADGLGDVKGALARLKGQAPFKAVLETRLWYRSGEGKDVDEDSGTVTVGMEDSGRGLQILYGKELLARMEGEQRARGRDANAKMPTLTTLREIDAVEVLPMVSAAGALTRVLEKAVFKSERADNYNGAAARLLSFDIPIETLSDRERKYAKKFDGVLELWIGADGTPLASRVRKNVSGRAMVVISFESHVEESSVFSVVGDRLLALRRESKSSNAGAGEKDERKVVKTLQLLP
jgi:hypothetical protein